LVCWALPRWRAAAAAPVPQLPAQSSSTCSSGRPSRTRMMFSHMTWQMLRAEAGQPGSGVAAAGNTGLCARLTTRSRGAAQHGGEGGVSHCLWQHVPCASMLAWRAWMLARTARKTPWSLRPSVAAPAPGRHRPCTAAHSGRRAPPACTGSSVWRLGLWLAAAGRGAAQAGLQQPEAVQRRRSRPQACGGGGAQPGMSIKQGGSTQLNASSKPAAAPSARPARSPRAARPPARRSAPASAPHPRASS